jgi:hypothetical protein
MAIMAYLAFCVTTEANRCAAVHRRGPVSHRPVEKTRAGGGPSEPPKFARRCRPKQPEKSNEGSCAAASQDRDVTSRGVVDCRIGHRRIRREGKPHALYLARAMGAGGRGCRPDSRSTGPHPVQTALAVCSCCAADTATRPRPGPSLSPIATRQRPAMAFVWPRPRCAVRYNDTGTKAAACLSYQP